MKSNNKLLVMISVLFINLFIITNTYAQNEYALLLHGGNSTKGRIAIPDSDYVQYEMAAMHNTLRNYYNYPATNIYVESMAIA